MDCESVADGFESSSNMFVSFRVVIARLDERGDETSLEVNHTFTRLCDSLSSGIPN